MFVCEPCHDKPSWNCQNGMIEGFMRSRGKCELCGTVANCLDCHGYKLAPAPEAETNDYESQDVLVLLLDETMVLVGESGGLSAVYGRPVPYGSGEHAVTVLTEHGTLLVTRTATVKVLVDGEGEL